MKHAVKMIKFSLLVVLSACFPLFCIDILVHTPEGMNFIVDMQPNDTFEELQDHINSCLNRDFSEPCYEENYCLEECLTANQPVAEFWMDFALFNLFKREPVVSVQRNYCVPLSQSNRDDITYVVRTLANKSIATILKSKSALDAAGVRLKPVHPFRFLECIFTDEELKVGIRNIKKRGWIWGDFMGGLVGSLNEESAKNNLPDEFIFDFARTVGIDGNLIINEIHTRQWDRLVEILIANVPRAGGSGRYDM